MMINTLPGLIATVDPSGEVEFVNQPILDFFGKTAELLRDWAPLIHPDDREHVIAMWRRLMPMLRPGPYQDIIRLVMSVVAISRSGNRGHFTLKWPYREM
jgi:PAS domain-containing protein